MLGRDHALSGALIFAALAPALHVTGGHLATGVALSAGAGVLPDIDHPDSSMALSFGFLTNSFSWLVEHVSGGHRHLTHAILGVTLFTAGALAAGRYQLAGPHATLSHLAFSWHLVPAGLFITLLYASALRALKIGGHHGDLHRRDLCGLPVPRPRPGRRRLARHRAQDLGLNYQNPSR
jgi:hypothetical protein